MAVFSLMIFSLKAQDFSNKGKDFWLGYGYHCQMVNSGTGIPQTNGGSQDMILYFTSDQNSSVTVEIPAVGYSRTYSIIANQVTESEAIPKSGVQDAKIIDTGKYNRGIHVFSNNSIVAYAHIYNSSISGASLLFPTNTLGQEYYSVNYTQVSNQNYSNGFFFVVATEDTTVVEITPSVANKNNRAAGVPFYVTLNKGEVYNVMGSGNGTTGTDLTGSRIRTVSSAGSCKKIAVFSGCGKISIPTGSADNLFQQALPSNAWGNKYLTSPTTSQAFNYFRVVVRDPSTVVKLNGSVMTGLVNNFYYQFGPTNVPNVITADKPIMVAQYCTTQGQSGNGTPGDPEMIYLSSVEQTINDITLNSTPYYQILTHYINVVVKAGGQTSFKLDNVNRSSSFIPHPQDPNYYYASFNVASGAHNIKSDSGFNAIAYGFGNAESYGYNAGTNVIDLNQYVTLQNQYTSVNFPSTCKNTPFSFAITLPYQPLKLNWNFNNEPNLSPNNSVVNNNPVYDSTFVRNGKNLYVYKLPGNYTFSQAGNYPIKVLVNNPSSDGCTGDQEITYQVQVYNAPIPNFKVNSNGCSLSPITFIDSSNANGRTIIKWKWNFGDGTTDSIKSPTKTYANGGTYYIKYTIITDIGCIADTTKSITLSPPPIAKFGVRDSICINSIVKFTDSSSVASPGTIVKWYWNFGNGVKDTLSTNASPTASYADTGTYTVTLIVETATGCRSNVFSKQIIIRSSPIANFSLPTVVCLPVGLASFTNTSSINDGTTSELTYKWLFGNGDSSTQKNPSTNYSSTGPFNIKLIATSKYGCTKDSTKTLSTIYAQPKAIFNVSPEVCLRDTTIFTDLSDGKGSTVVKWYWNFGDGNTDTIQHPKHLYTVAKTDTAFLYVKTDKGCISDTMIKTTVVNPLPLAGFKVSNPLCEKRNITFTDTSIANVGTLTQWGWNMGNGNTYTFSTLPNPFIEVYDTTGTYYVKLMVVNSKGCKSDSTLPTAITLNPLPHVGFILPDVCLDDAFAQFFDTTKIADGSQNSFSWKWNFGDPNASLPLNPNTSTVKNPIHKYSDTGIYQVKLLVTSNKFCSDSLTKNFTVNGSTPKANFAVLNSGKLCSNDSVRIQNTSTVDFGKVTKIQIYWDTVNNPLAVYTDNDPYPNKIYSTIYTNFQQPASKNIYIKMLAYSGVSCISPKTIQITLRQSPKVQFNNIKSICNDTTARILTEATEIGGVPGTPIFKGQGIVDSTTGLFNPKILSPGIYPIKYTYTSTTYGCIDSATKSIKVFQSPVAKFGVSNPLCEKNNFNFIDSSIANVGNIVKWNWDYGDGNTSLKNNGSTYSYSYTTANSYNVSLKVTTDSGCFHSTSKTIKINYLPVVKFGLPTICFPDGNGTFLDSTTIGDNSNSQFTYLWNFGDAFDPTTSNQQNPTHKYSDTAAKNVQLIVTSKDGCKDSLTRVLKTIYPQPKANFGISPNKFACFGDALYYSDSSKGLTSNIKSWTWDLGFGYSSTLQNPIQVYSDTGVRTVSLFIYNNQNCVSDTFYQTIEIYPYPIIDLPASATFLQGGLLTINPIYYFGHNLTFKWTPNLDMISDTVLRAQVFPLEDRRYFLKLTGDGGCSATDDILVVVLKAPIIPNAFSPNNDGVNDFWEIKHLESYPGCTVQVFDRYGRQVYYSLGYIKNWNGKFGNVDLPIGTYYYIIDPKNGREKMSGSITILR